MAHLSGQTGTHSQYGMRAILGRRPRKPDEYRLCVGDDDESKELCSALVEDEESRIGSPASLKSIS